MQSRSTSSLCSYRRSWRQARGFSFRIPRCPVVLRPCRAGRRHRSVAIGGLARGFSFRRWNVNLGRPLLQVALLSLRCLCSCCSGRSLSLAPVPACACTGCVRKALSGPAACRLLTLPRRTLPLGTRTQGTSTSRSADTSFRSTSRSRMSLILREDSAQQVLHELIPSGNQIFSVMCQHRGGENCPRACERVK